MKRPFIPKRDGISGRAWETAEPRDLSKPDGRRSSLPDPRFAHCTATFLDAPPIVAGRYTRVVYKGGKRIEYVDGVKIS